MQSSMKFLAMAVMSAGLSSLSARAGDLPQYNIVCLGDSITYGDTLSDPSTQAAAVRCGESLAARFQVAVNLSNQGHGGHTTHDWLPGSATDFPKAMAAAAALEAQHPGQLVFPIMLGTNDSAESGPYGAPVSPENYRKNLQTIIDGILGAYPKAVIIVHYPIWHSAKTPGDIACLTRLQSYFPEINQLVSNNSTLHPGRVFRGDTHAYDHFEKNHATELTAETGPNGIGYCHPNSAGAITLGKYWADAIAAALHLKAK
jgi:lysophospholipase L1-like esterase